MNENSFCFVCANRIMITSTNTRLPCLIDSFAGYLISPRPTVECWDHNRAGRMCSYTPKGLLSIG